MKVIIKLALLFSAISFTICNTSEPEFEQVFKVKHLKNGDGKNFPPSGSLVKVHYTGTFPENGKKFDSSVDRNRPFTFKLQKGQVIRCWDEVVGKMSLGEKLYVICPFRLAYGERGAGGVIPPNTDLGFEIELLDFNSDL